MPQLGVPCFLKPMGGLPLSELRQRRIGCGGERREAGEGNRTGGGLRTSVK